MNKNVLSKMAILSLGGLMLFGCKRKGGDDPIPDPDPVKNTVSMLISDFDGGGIFPAKWNSSNDGTEMADYAIKKDPDAAQLDSALYMGGEDTDSDWWIGTALGGDNVNGAVFGLPNDGSRVYIEFDIYAENSTSNLEIQLQEKDGDVFSWNLGADGGKQAPVGSWTTYQTATLDKFALAGFFITQQGDKKFTPESLSNVSLSLISGTAQGNQSKIYIDNIRFVVTEFSDVATPTNLSAKAKSKSQVDLKWSDNSTNETAYIVERATGTGTFVPIDTLAVGSSSFSDMNLSSTTSYKYKVKAIADTKSSNYSNTATVTTLAAATTEILVSNFNSDNMGVANGKWASTSDGTELVTQAIVVNPLGATPDSVLFLSGIDTDADYWIGSALGGDNKNGTKFGLPADISKIAVQFKFLAGNATSNLDIQLQEADGDVYTWNFGGDGGYQASQTEWVTYTVPFSAFKLASWGKAGDNVFAPNLLSNLSIALISGGGTGNEAIAYINDVKFIVSE
jgi:hypothetical protein